jgi:spermidine/putrescine transport system permease protein
MSDVARHDRLAAAVYTAPALLYLCLFFLVPMAVVAGYSLRDAGGGVTLAHYQRALDPLYVSVLLRSAWFALMTTLIALALGYPCALALRGMSSRARAVALALVVLPSWLNLLVKNYAWIVILRRQGILNTLLLEIGVIEQPLPLLFTTSAVLAGLVHTYLPFMVLPLYVALDRMDWSLVEAARDLAAGRWAVFRHVVLPQTLGGVAVGCTLVFVPALGAFVTPDLLGGPESLMVGTLVENQVLQVRDWPFASALSVVLMAVVLAVLALVRRWLTTPGQEGLL